MGKKFYIWVTFCMLVTIVVSAAIVNLTLSQNQNDPIIIPSLTPINIEPLTFTQAEGGTLIFYVQPTFGKTATPTFSPPEVTPIQGEATIDLPSLILSQEPPEFP